MEKSKEFYVHKDHMVAFLLLIQKYDLRTGLSYVEEGDDTIMLSVWYSDDDSIQIQGIKKLQELTKGD